MKDNLGSLAVLTSRYRLRSPPGGRACRHPAPQTSAQTQCAGRRDHHRHRDLLHVAARRHRGRAARGRRRTFLRRARFERVGRARYQARHRPFRPLAPRLRQDPVRQSAGGRRAAWRGGRQRAGACRRRARAGRRALDLLRAAGRQPRHLCRRRRFGAAVAADRRGAHDGHDAHRPHLFGRGRPGHGAFHSIWPSRTKASPRASSLPPASPATRRSPISRSCTRCRASPKWIPPAGYAVEALMSSIAQADGEAKARLKVSWRSARQR